jgi:uncharacterized protein (DUF2062 family)
MGKPFVLGLFLLALILAAFGYPLVIAAWRVHVMLSWSKRRLMRSSRQENDGRGAFC